MKIRTQSRSSSSPTSVWMHFTFQLHVEWRRFLLDEGAIWSAILFVGKSYSPASIYAENKNDQVSSTVCLREKQDSWWFNNHSMIASTLRFNRQIYLPSSSFFPLNRIPIIYPKRLAYYDKRRTVRWRSFQRTRTCFVGIQRFNINYECWCRTWVDVIFISPYKPSHFPIPN